MNKFTLIALLLYLIPSNYMHAQGFSHAYDLGMSSIAFGNLDISNDTITIFGLVRDTSPPNPIGILFVQLDTLGNVLNEKRHFVDESCTSNHRQGFVKLSNNSGYAVVGTHFLSQRGYLCRLSNSGDLIYFNQYPKLEGNTYYWNDIIEIPGGFFVSGDRQMDDFNNSSFIAKLDYNGNFQWIKDYDGGSLWDGHWDLLKVNENEVVLSQGSYYQGPGPMLFDESYTQLFGVDTAGTINWFWESPDGESESGANRIILTSEGNWGYSTAKGFHDDYLNEDLGQAKIVKRDSNFNLLWEKPIGYKYNSGGLYGLQELQDKSIIACGFLSQSTTEAGVISKITEHGDSVWLRFDSVFYNPNLSVTNKIVALDLLSSGSIIACGQTIDYMEEISYGWVLKISPNGCIDTLDCTSTSLTEQAPALDIELYPNPASTGFHINSAGPYTKGRFVITNLLGEIFLSGKMTESTHIATQDWPKGMYVVTCYPARGNPITKQLLILDSN